MGELGERRGDRAVDGVHVGAGLVEVCDRPRRLVVITTEDGEEEEHTMTATLSADGEQTVLVIEETGMPLDQRAAYGAGLQIHVEDLAAVLAGRDRCDARARWAELLPAYQELAIHDGSPVPGPNEV